MKKNKTNRKGDKGKSNIYDQCQTPYYALDPLIPYLNPDWLIWESAAGEGQVVTKLTESGFSVVGTDILTGHNFYTYEPSHWDCQVTNPPFSTKYDWLERCYKLGKPFALLMPVDTIGAASALTLFQKYGVGIITLSKRVDFKMPNKGYTGSAHFASMWFTWGLSVPDTVLTYGQIIKYPDEQMMLWAQQK